VSRTVKPWDYVLLRKFQELIQARSEALAAGSAEDYAAYRHLCGEIRGIQIAMAELTQVREDSGMNEDDDLKG
jgi:hypothetical protein